MWKLTCYGHWKYFPCDVTGDISYEELRAVAYEEAKRGIPLQSIVRLTFLVFVILYTGFHFILIRHKLISSFPGLLWCII
jgi:hypothetical protein